MQYNGGLIGSLPSEGNHAQLRDEALFKRWDCNPGLVKYVHQINGIKTVALRSVEHSLSQVGHPID